MGKVLLLWKCWKAFANCKTGNLHQMKGKLNQTDCYSILQHHVIPYGTQPLDQGFVLMQDNYQKHTSKLCQRYIKSKEEQHVLQLTSWSTQSSNLNPIELVWDKMTENWCALSPSALTSGNSCWKAAKNYLLSTCIFGGKNVKNLWSSVSYQRESFWWLKSLRSSLHF